MPNSRRIGPDTIIRTGCIVVVDQAGFTRNVLEHSTADALSDVWLMRRELIPVFRQFGGEVFKVDADNLYVFFDRVEPALEASAKAHRTLIAASRKRKRPVAACIGIGYGELFYISSEDDYYGPEVNLASKLGEDVAEAGETFLTEAAVAAIRDEVDGRPGRPRAATLSGVKVKFRPWKG